MNDITTGILDTVDPVMKELSTHITNPVAAVCAVCCCGLLSIVSLVAIEKKTELQSTPPGSEQ